MLGYVRVEKGELKVREYEAYRGLYCSLCRALSKRYGIFSRLILSYDMTFLAMVRLSKDGVLPSFRPGRCPFNPAKRCNYCTNAQEQFDLVCAAAVLMFYYKVKDNLADEGFFRRILMLFILPLAALWRKKAIRVYSAIDFIISSAMQAQSQIEKSGTDSFDRAAHASADALGQIFAFETSDENRALYRFGYAVGRWVYLTDAADDYEKDRKKGRFNVFVTAYDSANGTLNDVQKQQIRETLYASAGMALEAFKQTGCEILTPVIENVLTEGMIQTTDHFTKGDEADERPL